MHPEEQVLEVHQYTLFSHFRNALFNVNLGQNMLKNVYFFGKKL